MKKRNENKELTALLNAKRILNTAKQNMKSSGYHNMMAGMCEELAEFCKLIKQPKEAKEWEGLTRLFKTLYKIDTRTKGFLSLFYDVNKTDIVKEDKEVSSLTTSFDFKDKRSSPCKITRRLDGTIELYLEGLSLIIPKRYWKEYKEVEK